MITRMYFIRHGETPWNVEGKVQGSIDIPLTQRGEQQAQLLGHRLKGEFVSAIYSSPQLRAWQTAQAIARYHPHLSLTAVPELAEFSLGELEGKLVGDIERDYDWDRISNDDAYRISLGAEPVAQTVAWANIAFPQFARQHQNETIVFTTHGAKKKRLLKTLFANDQDIQQRLETEHPSNCSLALVEWHSERGPSLSIYNDTSHLEMLG